MTNKRIQLPKEGHLRPEEARAIGPGEAQFIDETDVEGHAWTNPAPPTDFSKGLPSRGGELLPTDVTGDLGPDRAR